MASRRSGPIRADQVHAGRAQRLHRQEIAEQRTVGDIDRNGPACDVGAPGRLVARQDLRGDPGSSPSEIALPAISAMSAASRSPMLRPCAPIGGTTWADSPTSATRLLANLLGLLDRQRKQIAPGLDLDAAENGMRLLFGGFGQFVVAQRHQPLGFRGRRNPHHAAAVAGQGHEHAGPVRRMKLGGDVLVRPANGRC